MILLSCVFKKEELFFTISLISISELSVERGSFPSPHALIEVTRPLFFVPSLPLLRAWLFIIPPTIDLSSSKAIVIFGNPLPCVRIPSWRVELKREAAEPPIDVCALSVRWIVGYILIE